MGCSVGTWIGDVPAALRAGTAAVEFHGRVSPWCAARANGALAEARLAAGDSDGCLDQVESAGGPDLPGADPWSRCVWYEMLTRAELARGRMDRATEWAERAVANARRLGLAGSRGLGHLAMSHLCAAHDPSAAVGHGRAAAALFLSAGMVLEMGRARLITGCALVTLGETDRAIEELSGAHAVFESCGARRLFRQAVRERRRLAGQASRRPSANGLTRREQQVANLAADGLTNRKIAQRLYITEKTVEVHLSRVYAKLGVSTRTALATIIVRALSRPHSKGLEPMEFERHPTVTRYTGKAQSYARFTPTFPPEIVQALRVEAGWGPDTHVADVGSGTGSFTRLLLDARMTAYAIEPNAAMRQEAERALGHEPRFHSIAGSAEQTMLPGRAVDGITCAQSFHWFEVSRTVPEFRRIIRPGGTVGLIWFQQRNGASQFEDAYQALLAARCPDRSRFADLSNLKDLADSSTGTAGRSSWSPSRVFGGAAVREHHFVGEDEISLEILKDRTDSLSYTPPSGTPEHADLMARIEDLFAAHAVDDVVHQNFDVLLLCLQFDGAED